MFDIFNNIAPNINCGFTLEPPHLGGYEFNHNLFFGSKIRKLDSPLFYCIKLWYKGV